jgi:simple sugar transport system ATP-binding protein
VQSLSGGNQQRAVLARWLSTRARILVLNGPTAGVDIGSKADIHAKLKELAGQGPGIIVISDDLPEPVQNCNRVLVMEKGRVVGHLQGTKCPSRASPKLEVATRPARQCRSRGRSRVPKKRLTRPRPRRVTSRCMSSRKAPSAAK